MEKSHVEVAIFPKVVVVLVIIMKWNVLELFQNKFARTTSFKWLGCVHIDNFSPVTGM